MMTSKIKTTEYEYLIDLLSEKHLKVSTRNEMEYIVSLKVKLRQLMYKELDEE